jgi:pimeloyl-ACP methyl ester carboxylesterase
VKEFLTLRHPGPLFLPKGKGFGHPADAPIALPSWLSEDDVNYYVSKFEKKGFTGGLNYYRNIDRYVFMLCLILYNYTYILTFPEESSSLFSIFQCNVDCCIYFSPLSERRNWELTAPWTGAQVKVPAKFIVGDQDLVYNSLRAKDFIHNGGFKKCVPFLEEVVVIEGAAHFINQEKADEISKHIFDFIKKFQ